MIRRFEDWSPRLIRFLVQNRSRPFCWGSWDCCLFASDAVREITGTDLAVAYRGQYHTMLGALRFLHGSVVNVAEEIAWRYGIAAHAAAQDARPGDVILGCLEGTATLGIVSPARLAVFATTQGLADFPFSAAQRAWRIG